MAKAIASYPKSEQKRVIASRLASNTGGLGYLAARDGDYRLRMAEARKQIVKKEAEKSQA